MVVSAAIDGLDARGYGMSSVRFICGTQDIHRELEFALTGFLGTEDTLLFPSCMDANAGVFEALLGENDVLIADRLVHASIVDVMRLCKAMQDTYKHSDMAHLEEKLVEHKDKRFRLIITDGVFSMDGDVAKLDEIVAAAHAALDARGYGMSSVRFICGTQDLHRTLEARLTEFLGVEDTLLFPSCMDANAGVFEALFGEPDVLIADRLVHASIVDGMRLCKAGRTPTNIPTWGISKRSSSSTRTSASAS